MAVIWCFPAMKMNLRQWSSCKDLKELVFGAYPQYRDDKDINIMLTYILYGCYYAFYENRKYGDVPVLSSITELTGKAAQAALNMIKN